MAPFQNRPGFSFDENGGTFTVRIPEVAAYHLNSKGNIDSVEYFKHIFHTFTWSFSAALVSQTKTLTGVKDAYKITDLVEAAKKKIVEALTDPKGKCAKLLGSDGVAEFERISKNIVYDEEGKKVGSAHAQTIDEDIYLRPTSYVFNENNRAFFSGLTKDAHKSLLASKAGMEKADEVIKKNGISNFDYAVAAVIHEFLHATGVFEPDVERTEGEDGSIKIDAKDSVKNQRTVVENCFKKQKIK